jgi:hypothetical protein
LKRAWLVAFVALAACTSARDPIPHGQSGECARCHLPEFRAAPEHPQKKPTTCSVCHGQQSWKPTFLDHRWPLTGTHRKLDCFKCHTDTPPAFEGTKQHCYDCHRADYERAPWHDTLQKTCGDCHGTKSWKEGAKWPPKKPEPSASVPPLPSASVPPLPSASAPPKPKPKPPKPKPPPTTPTTPPVLPPDIISHPSGR